MLLIFILNTIINAKNDNNVKYRANNFITCIKGEQDVFGDAKELANNYFSRLAHVIQVFKIFE